MMPDIATVEAYIRQKAAQLGINPDVAVRVAKSEGRLVVVGRGRGSRKSRGERAAIMRQKRCINTGCRWRMA